MKRIVALVLSFALAFVFCACSGVKGEENKGNGIDLAAAMLEGKIPELDIALSQDVSTIHVSEDHSHQDAEEGAYSFVSGDEFSYFLNEQAFAFYKTDKMNKGISVVLSINKAFGLSCNNYQTADDIKSAFPEITFNESVVDSGDMKIMPYMLDTTKKLTYTSGKRQAVFYVMDDQLIAAALIDTENWN